MNTKMLCFQCEQTAESRCCTNVSFNDKTEQKLLDRIGKFGIRGMAAYAYHALALGYSDDEVNAFFVRISPLPCNDAYSAIQVALALAQALGCGVNYLPLSIVLSWYEQKAVCVLLTLLALGIKNIRLRPSLPAFVSPAVLNFLVKNYGIAPTTTPDKDLEAYLD